MLGPGRRSAFAALLPAALRGFRSTLDLSGDANQRALRRLRERTDVEAAADDWHRIGEDYRRATRRVVSEAPDDQRARLTRVLVEAELTHHSMAVPRTHQRVTASLEPLLQRHIQHLGTADGALAAFREAQRRHELALEKALQQMQDVS